MKSSSISEQLELQNQNLISEKKKDVSQSREKENMISCNLDSKQDNKHAYDQQYNSDGNSLLSIFSLENDSNCDATLADYLQAQKRKKKKGIRQ